MTISGDDLRTLRSRLGLTQLELAESLGVDQATVSRWERGVDRPRPARVARIRDLLLKDHTSRALRRQLAMVRLNLRLAAVVRDFRLDEVSQKAVVHFARTRGIDVSDHVGRSFMLHAERMGNAAFAELFTEATVRPAEVLIARVQVNIGGHGSLLEAEPLSGEWSDANFLIHQVCTFEAEPTGEIRVERVEIVPLDEPTTLLPVIGADAPPRAAPLNEPDPVER